MPPDRWLAITVRAPAGSGRTAGTSENPLEGVQWTAGLASDSSGTELTGEPRGVALPEDPFARVPEILVEFGGRGVEERDGAFTTYLPPPDDLEALLEEVENRVRGVVGASVRLEWYWQAQEDWATYWRRGLGPRRASDRILVAPTWEIPEVQEGEVLVVLDPGMAFGTAEHATTRGCLRLLDRQVRAGDRIADIGSGSGILSITAALLGADEILALEMDPMACEAARENALANGVEDRVQILAKELAAGEVIPQAPFNGIVANIQRTILLPLLPVFQMSLVDGGWLILSGILEEERTEVQEAAAARAFSLEGGDQEGEWWSGVFRSTVPSDSS
jgi:ribosomal protein L11 methyltransferase